MPDSEDRTDAARFDPALPEPEPGDGCRVTTEPAVIRSWAEHRGARPAVASDPGRPEGPEPLRINFPGYREDGLREVSWDEWFRLFDDRELAFVFREQTAEGGPSSFYRLDSRANEP
ncbi:hypothetical protein [Nocardia wallacei]|uniref:hypothetical protein n=1 Tax=Nocardia wallacei TaxID=480035 RepID=UPI002456831F|nr:hypothetical protein [Nocardia wallacei]